MSPVFHTTPRLSRLLQRLAQSGLRVLLRRLPLISLGLALLVLASFASSCAAPTQQHVSHLATAQLARDFETYDLRRVGLLPFRGHELDADQADVLQAAFFAELSQGTPYEVVPLQLSDLEEVPGSDPFRRGWYDPRTILDVSRRYTLDGVFVGTVTDYQFFMPQRIAVQLDLVPTETGVAIWSASLHLDATEPRTRGALQAFYAGEARHDPGDEGWEVSLLSPRLFARFAAWQVARLL